MQVVFPEKTADIRMTQYESGTRTPKEEITKALADVLDVSPMALSVPDIDSYIGIMHTLFALEDLYGFKIDKLDDEVCIRLDKNCGDALIKDFDVWQKEAEKYRVGEISKEDYDKWRYNYPEYDTSKHGSNFFLKSCPMHLSKHSRIKYECNFTIKGKKRGRTNTVLPLFAFTSIFSYK